MGTTKLSYKDQRLLRILPDEIAGLEKRIAEIEQRLYTETDLYAAAPAEFDALTEELQTCRLQKEEKENTWLEISLKAEALQQ